MAVDEALRAALDSAEPDARQTGTRKRPQRNPAFSTTSRLIVLREPAPAAPPLATEHAFAEPSTPPDAATYTPQNTRGFAQHELVLSEYESRSHWHKQRTRGEAATPLPSMSAAQADASPPSFFTRMFPERAPPRWSEEPRGASPPPAAPPPPASPLAEAAASPASPASLRSLSPVCEAPPATALHETAWRVAARIEVRGWRQVGSPMHGWVVYDIYVKTPSGHELHTHKRYRAFLELAEALERECPQHAASLPPLPPRHAGLWQRYHPAFLEGRRRALQAWLDATAVRGPWRSSAALAAWVLSH